MTDPADALGLTQARVQHQQLLGAWVTHVVGQMEDLRREDHLADRMAAVLGMRR